MSLSHVVGIVALLTPLMVAATAPSANPPVEVATAVSWMTVMRPEINVLLRNHGDVAVNFSVSFLEPNFDTQPPCVRRSEPELSIGSAQWTLQDGRDDLQSLGIVPPHGWAHRVVVLASSVLRPPCNLNYVIHLTDAAKEWRFQGPVNVPAQPTPLAAVSSAPPVLETSVMVEKDIFDRHLLVRLLVENKGANAERVWVSDRTLKCKPPTRVDWSTERPVPQGQDIGPAFISGHSWAVLVSAVRLIEGESAAGCTGSITLSRPASPEWLPWKTVEFELKPTGQLRPLRFDD